MNRITVSHAVAEKLRRFPTTVNVCAEEGYTLCWINRLDPPGELPEDQTLSVPEIEQTLRQIFAKN